jgi:hypothetical protein
LVLLLLVAGLLPAAAAQARDSDRDQLLAIVEKAQALDKAGKKAEALEQYEAALALAK